MNWAILSILSQKKSSHGNLQIRKFPVVRKYLRIRNFPVVRKKIYGSVSEAGELGLSNHLGFAYCYFGFQKRSYPHSLLLMEI